MLICSPVILIPCVCIYLFDSKSECQLHSQSYCCSEFLQFKFCLNVSEYCFHNAATWMFSSCILHHSDHSLHSFSKQKGPFPNLAEALSSARNLLMCFTSPFLLLPSPYQWTCIVRVMNCSGGGQKCNGHQAERREPKQNVSAVVHVLPATWFAASWKAISDNLAAFSLRCDSCFEVVISEITVLFLYNWGVFLVKTQQPCLGTDMVVLRLTRCKVVVLRERCVGTNKGRGSIIWDFDQIGEPLNTCDTPASWLRSYAGSIIFLQEQARSFVKDFQL